MEPREICSGCNKEIDPEVCGCGGDEDDAEHGSGNPDSYTHPFIPMGCDCYRNAAAKRVEDLLGSLMVKLSDVENLLISEIEASGTLDPQDPLLTPIWVALAKIRKTAIRASKLP